MNDARTSAPKSSKAKDQRSDHDLIVAILSGDTHLFEVLIQPYEDRVFRVALLHMKDEEDAREVTQESLLKAFLKLNTFQGRSRFSTWLTSIAISQARNRLRQRNSLKRRSVAIRAEAEGAELVASVPDTHELPSQSIERQELSCLLMQAVEKLPSDYRRVFKLRVIQELSTRETAELLKITSASVKTRLHRARSLLQLSLRSNWWIERRHFTTLHSETSVV